MLAQPVGGELLINLGQKGSWSKRPRRMGQSGAQGREAALAEVEGAAGVSREKSWQVGSKLNGGWQ